MRSDTIWVLWAKLHNFPGIFEELPSAILVRVRAAGITPQALDSGDRQLETKEAVVAHTFLFAAPASGLEARDVGGLAEADKGREARVPHSAQNWACRRVGISPEMRSAE